MLTVGMIDPLQLPLDDDFGQVHGQPPLLDGDAGCEAQPLHGADHVLHQVVPHRVVHLRARARSCQGHCVPPRTHAHVTHLGPNTHSPTSCPRILNHNFSKEILITFCMCVYHSPSPLLSPNIRACFSLLGPSLKNAEHRIIFR